jgi:hypothetical protein
MVIDDWSVKEDNFNNLVEGCGCGFGKGCGCGYGSGMHGY